MASLENLAIGDIVEVRFRDITMGNPENMVGYFDYHSHVHIRLRNRSPRNGEYHGHNFYDCNIEDLISIKLLKKASKK